MSFLTETFPSPVVLLLDEERTLQLNIRGLQYLDTVYENTDKWLKVLGLLETGKGQVYIDTHHFVYACLLDRGNNSPLTIPQLEAMVEEGADIAAWVRAVSQAVRNFFLRRVFAENGNQAGARGHGTNGSPGPTGS